MPWDMAIEVIRLAQKWVSKMAFSPSFFPSLLLPSSSFLPVLSSPLFLSAERGAP